MASQAKEAGLQAQRACCQINGHSVDRLGLRVQDAALPEAHEQQPELGARQR